MEQKHIALLKTNFDFLYGKDVEPTSELLVYTVYLLETIGINLGCRFYLSSDSRLVSDQAENIMLITDITTEEALSSTQGFHPTEQRCSALKNIINKYKTTSYSIRQWVKAVAMTTYLVQNVIASNSSSNVIIKSVSNRCPDLTDETGDLPYAKQIISCAEELLNKTQTQNIVQSSYVKIKHPHHLRKLISSCTETPYSLLVKTITDENHDTLYSFCGHNAYIKGKRLPFIDELRSLLMDRETLCIKTIEYDSNLLHMPIITTEILTPDSYMISTPNEQPELYWN